MNEKIIATGSNDKVIKIMVVPENENATNVLELAIPDQKGTVRSILFRPNDDNFLVSGGTNDSNIHLWDTETGKRVQFYLGHSMEIHNLKYSVENEEILGSCGKDNKINFYDLVNDKPINSITVKNHGEINDITFSNSYVCSGHSDGNVVVYSSINNSVVKEFKAAGNQIRSVNFSLDGKFLLSASLDCTIKLFDVNCDFKLVKTIKHDDRAVSCKWHPDKPIFVSTSADKTARICLPKVY